MLSPSFEKMAFLSDSVPWVNWTVSGWPFLIISRWVRKILFTNLSSFFNPILLAQRTFVASFEKIGFETDSVKIMSSGVHLSCGFPKIEILINKAIKEENMAFIF
jgi:hypothetical protein